MNPYSTIVWIASVERIANPHQPIQISDSYGTKGKRKLIETTWSSVLETIFPNSSDQDDAIAPDLGVTQEVFQQITHTIPISGRRALTNVLIAVNQVLGIEYCPLLPDVVCLLLQFMPESYAYCTLREMVNSSYYLPVCQKDYYSWCKSFDEFVKRMSKDQWKLLSDLGVLTPENLEPVFRRFFVTILKREDALHFMDIFLVDGSKALFRLALSLVQLVPKSKLKVSTSVMLQLPYNADHLSVPVLTAHNKTLNSAHEWWDEIRIQTMDPSCEFEAQVKLMYPKLGKFAKRYPRRRVLKRAISFHQKWAVANMPIYIVQTPPKPIGFLTDKPIKLAKLTAIRSNLAKWLPTVLKTTKLDVIYSTEVHGRSFAAFYKECRRTKNTIILVEALCGNKSAIIGMFASHAWVVNPSSFGDGECFLFQAYPDPKCYNWVPDFSDDTEHQAVREQFMVARNEFIAMGANAEGTNGLRLDNDLNSGESYPTLGFENESLLGAGRERFEVGVMEVYRLMREVDGKAVDGDDESIWDLEGI